MKTFIKPFLLIILLIAFTGMFALEIDIDNEDALDRNVNVEAIDTIYDDVVSIGGNINVEGYIDGDVVSIGGRFYVNGIVEGDLILIGSVGAIDSNTIVQGEFVNIGSAVDINDNAELKGASTHLNLGPFNKFLNLKYVPYKKIDEGFKIGEFVSSIAKFILIFILSLAVILLFKKYRNAEKTCTDNPLQTFLAGFIGELLIIPGTIVLAISIIGIPLIPVFYLAIFVAVFMGSAIILNMIGRFLLEKLGSSNRHPAMTILTGLVAMSIFPLMHKIGAWANVGWLEGIFGVLSFIQWYIIGTYALGSFILSKFSTRIYTKENKEAEVIEASAE